MQVVRQVVERRPGRDRACVELAARERLRERLLEGAPDPHRLPDRLHLRAERRVGTGELLEREARELDDDVVEGRLEARRRRLRQVVRDLVERVADRELGRDLCDRIAGRLGGERRRAGDARIHLDHPQVAGDAVARELDVRAAGLDADGADHGDRRVAQLLIRLVGQRHLRRNRDGVTGVDAHRIEVLDRADDDDVVAPVADHLQLELVPAAHRLLDQHLSDRALAQAELDLGTQLRARRDEATAVAAQSEGRPHDRGDGDAIEVVERGDDPRARDREPAALHRRAEELAVLGAADHVDRCAQELDAEVVEHPLVGELDRKVERGLPAERRQQRIGPFPAEHVGDALEIERLEIGGVGKPGVGHDRRRVRVDDDRPEAVLAKHLQRLAARVVELAGLADDDRPGADQADRPDVCPTRHREPPAASARGSARRRAAPGRLRGGTGPSGR